MAQTPTGGRGTGRRGNPFSWQGLKDWFLYLYHETRIPLLALCVSLIALNHLGAINYALDTLGRGHIAEVNKKYLDDATAQAAESALILGGLHTGLAVLESSSAGISFIAEVKVQVGEVVSALKDLVDRAWTASLVATASLAAFDLILRFAAYFDPLIVTLTILSLGIHFAARAHFLWLSRITGQVGEILLLATLLVHLILPLMIYGTSIISTDLTRPYAADARATINDTHNDFAGSPDEKLDDHVKAVINHYKVTAKGDVNGKTRDFAGAVSKHIVVVLFDAFIVPLLLLGVMLYFGRIVIRHTIRVEDMVAEVKPRQISRR